MKNQSITVSLPESLVTLVEKLQEVRRDPTRSDTVRVLLLQALAAMSYLPESEKKALGIDSGRFAPRRKAGYKIEQALDLVEKNTAHERK